MKYKGILAIDFDGTICNTNYPEIKGLVTGAKKYINKLVDRGWYVIVWTCRCDDNGNKYPLEMMKNYLDDKGVKYHIINEHHPDLIKFYKNDTRKIAADFYIDDKNIFGLPAWSKIYYHLESLKDYKSCLHCIDIE